MKIPTYFIVYSAILVIYTITVFMTFTFIKESAFTRLIHNNFTLEKVVQNYPTIFNTTSMPFLFMFVVYTIQILWIGYFFVIFMLKKDTKIPHMILLTQSLSFVIHFIWIILVARNKNHLGLLFSLLESIAVLFSILKIWFILLCFFCCCFFLIYMKISHYLAHDGGLGGS